MGKYLIIQLKRLGRILPIILCVMAILFMGIYLVYQNLVTKWSDPEKFDKISVGMVGTANERLLSLGLNALKTMDTSNVSVEFLEMEEASARTALEKGSIAAYVVFPDGFMDNAVQGKIVPLQFVSAAGGENIISMVKDELTSALAGILLVSEQGSFAMSDILDEYGRSDISYTQMNVLALEYAERIMERAEVYTVEELGISEGLSFEEYMMSGLTVVFLFFMTLPFVAVFVKEEPAMEQLLKSKRIGAFPQVLCEAGSYFLFLLLLVTIPLVFLPRFSASSVLYILPVVFCVCGISYFVYSLTKDLLSGVLLQLIVAIALCFISGCMYPVYFFPVSVQKLTRYLPAAMMRNHIAGLITGEKTTDAILPLTAIGVGLVLACVLIRYFRIGGRKGARL